MANASIGLTNTDVADNDPVKTWTVFDLNGTTPTVTSGSATGTLDGAGFFTGSESITLTATALHGWDSAGPASPARSAVTGGTLEVYLATLDAVEMDAINSGGFGVDSSSVAVDAEQTKLNGVSEVLVFTVDTSSLASTSSLTIESFSFDLYGANDRTDFVIYDVSADSIIEAQWDQNYNGGDSVSGSWTVEDGDLIIIATGASGTDSYRISAGFVALDVSSTLTEPPGPHPPGESGPGFPNLTQVVNGIPLAEFNTDSNNTDLDVRTVVLDYIDGYLYMDTRGLTTGGSNHTIHSWDISDLSAASEVNRVGGERGQHTASRFLPAYRVNNRGDRFVNVSDPLNMLNANPPGYTLKSRGSRGCYPLPYEYFGGSAVEIYDARTGTTLAEVSDHGFTGLTIPIGNLMIVVGIRGATRGVATYDISDPSDPRLLDVISPTDPVWNDSNPAYEAAIWKHYVVIPNVLGGGTGDDVAFVDFSDPTNLRHVLYTNGDGSYSSGLPGRTRYAQFQDNKMFLGCGIYDMTPLESDLEPTLLDVHEHNGEYMLPLGNLYVSAENTEQGTIPDFAGPYPVRIFAHQAAPDTNPPTVAYTDPADGATNQHVKSRVGVIIHETLRYGSINSTTFRVFPLAGGPDVTGTLNATDKDIVIFTPDADLAEGTTYRVLLDGIQDAAGNAMTAFSFDFTTAGPGGAPSITITDVSSSPYPALVGGTTNLSVVASGGLPPLEYSWDFGDGNPATTFSSSDANISHTYTARGHYSAQVQVRDSSVPPQTRTDSVVVTATTAPAGPLSTKGSQIIADETNRRIWCVNPDNNTIASIEADTLAKLSEYPVGKDPRSIAQDSSGNLWITCIDDNTLEVRDDSDGSLIAALNFGHGARPHDVVFNRLKSCAYVTLKGSGKVVRIDPAVSPLQIDVLLDAGPSPTAIAVNQDTGKILVNRFISPDTNGEVRSFDNADMPGMGLETTIPLAVDTTSEDNGQEGRGLLNYLADVAIDPLNQYAYVSAKKDNIFRGALRDGQPLTHETTVRPIVAKIDLATNTEVLADRIDIDDSSQPTALAFSPLGDYLFIAMQGNNDVRVVDTFSGNITATLASGLAPQGLAFDTVTGRLFIKNLTDRTVTVFDLTDALTEGDFNQPALATISTVASESFAADVLLGKQIFYNAGDERMSFEGYLSCAVCHQDGDHDGRTWDFTDRGEGLRNTANLRGRSGTGHGNVHWSANFDEIQDFELDMLGAFGGTGFLAAVGGPNPSLDAPNAGRNAELDALAAYVASLGTGSIESSPHRNADGTLTAAAQAGKLLFEGTIAPASGTALSCTTCHNPATGYTDSTVGNNTSGAVTLHDVGTIKASSGERLGGGPASLTGIDTPTLLGLHAAAPYLHDGSATTVAEVFDQFDAGAALGQDGSAHDLSATGCHLTPTEASYLIDYLMQIDGSAESISPEITFRLLYAMNLDGSDDFLDRSNNGVANIFYFLFGLGDPNQTSVPALTLGASPAAGVPILTPETDGTYTFSYVRHLTQTAYDYIAMTAGDLMIWADVDNPSTPHRPTSTSTTPLDADHEIRHLHFDYLAPRSYFTVKVESAD